MTAFFEPLFSQVPWLKPVLAWMVAILVIWVLAAIPAYFILPYIQSIYARLVGAALALHGSVSDERRRRSELRSQLRGRLLEDHSLRRFGDEKARLWRATSSELVEPLGRLQARAKALYREIAATAKRVRTLELVWPALSSLPSASEILDSSARDRVSVANLITGAILLAAAMMVNVGMLGQIIKDLALIPEDLTYLSLPLTQIFALLLTCVEAGMGYMLGAVWTREQSESGRQLSLSGVAIAGVALAIAFVEGFFYSRIGSSPGEARLEFELPIPGTDVRMSYESVFFIWGFALVTALCGFGVMFHNALAAVLRGGAIRQLRRQLTELAQSAGQWKETLGETQKALERTVEEAGKAETVLGEYDAKVTAVGRAIEEAASYRPSPDDAKPRPISEGEARAAEYGTVMWIGITVASAALMIRISPSPLRGAAVAIVCIAAGAFLRSTFDRGVSGATERLQHIFQAACAIAGVCAVIGFLLGAKWLIPTSLAIVILLCSYELTGLIGFASLLGRALAHAVVTAVEVVAIAGLYLLRLVVLAVDYVVAVVAAPAKLVFGPPRQTGGV